MDYNLREFFQNFSCRSSGQELGTASIQVDISLEINSENEILGLGQTCVYKVEYSKRNEMVWSKPITLNLTLTSSLSQESHICDLKYINHIISKKHETVKLLINRQENNYQINNN